MPSFTHVTMYMYLTLQNLDAIIGHPDYSAATISNDACLLKMKVCFLLVLPLILVH